MRTTLDIDEDILSVAKELATQRNQTAGRVLSDLARQALIPNEIPVYKNGIRLMQRSPGSKITTLEDVKRFRD